jgi:hypothetical protein
LNSASGSKIRIISGRRARTNEEALDEQTEVADGGWRMARFFRSEDVVRF